MYDERTNLAQQVADEVRSVFGELVFETVVPRNVRLAEAPSFGRPIHAYDLRCRGVAGLPPMLGREYLARMEAEVAWRKQALGRGLKALMPDTPRARTGLVEIPSSRSSPIRSQPRQRFVAEALAELAGSIRQHGVLQPLLVSERSPTAAIVLVAGERRWRAARQAGLAHGAGGDPRAARTRTAMLELALVENLQRRDLTPLEEARAFEQLAEPVSVCRRPRSPTGSASTAAPSPTPCGCSSFRPDGPGHGGGRLR